MRPTDAELQHDPVFAAQMALARAATDLAELAAQGAFPTELRASLATINSNVTEFEAALVALDSKLDAYEVEFDRWLFADDNPGAAPTFAAFLASLTPKEKDTDGE